MKLTSRKYSPKILKILYQASVLIAKNTNLRKKKTMLHYHYSLITASPDGSTLACVKLAFSRTSGPI